MTQPTQRFRNDGQFFADQESLQTPLALYGIRDFSFTEAASGIENSTFLVKTSDADFALRIYRQDKKLDGEIAQELAFMDVLRAQHIPVPAVHHTQLGQRVARFTAAGVYWDAILMDRMPGEHPEGGYTSDLVERMADIQARMHLAGIEFAKTQPQHTRVLTHLKERHFLERIHMDSVQDERLRGLLERAAQYKLPLDPALPRGYSHFDFDAGNLLVDEQGTLTAVLDFDDLMYAPVSLCLAYTLWDVLDQEGGEALVRQYLAAYEAKRMLSTLERRNLAPFMLFRHYVITALGTLEGYTDQASIARAVRLEQYLQTGNI